MWIVLALLGLGLTLGASFWLHRLDATGMRHHWFDPRIDGLPTGIAALGYGLLLAAIGRPILSGLGMAGGAGLLFVLNRLKERSFHEPIVFLDFTLLGQVVRYPRFYVPYLFPRPVLVGGVAVALGLAGLWRIEPPMTAGARLGVLAITVVFAAGAWFWLDGLLRPSGRSRALSLLARLGPTLAAKADFARLGLFASMLGHGLYHVHARSRDGRPGIPPAGADRPATRPRPSSALAPHLVLVQAESFFDIRRHLAAVPAGVLSHYDRLRAAGQGGRFLVPTHGAYTMRTEFAVLTGLGPETLGTDAFNPYVTTARQPVPSLAWTLRASGYRSLCLHPFHETFFRRDQVMPHLGFEGFESLPRFAGLPRCGPYISDAVLGRRILERLAESDGPQFVFAITIEAHGPWTADRLRPAPSAMDAPGALGVYLWHLRHMDALFAMLAAALGRLSRPAILCGYGDHVAGLPGVGRPGMADPTATDWFLWSSRGDAGPDRDVRPEELAGLLRGALEASR